MNIFKVFIGCLAFLSCSWLQAQPVEGVIIYEQASYWTRIVSRMDYLSQEEKDRVKLTWGSDDKEITEMKLVFTPDKSYYTYVSAQREYGDGRFTQKLSEYVICRDFAKNVQTDWIEMLGRVYQVEDSIRVPKWKVMNKIKDIQGHVCMMAVTEDTIKNYKITAWFADDIPASVGPGLYFGLPGAILELEANEGDIVLTAKKIELRPVGDEIQPSKKLKGRKINLKTYDALLSKHFYDSIKSRRNPYWSVPF
ncbi:MAG: hypothetical protein ABS46_19330 [Cytophagaceae bacterium SCN 52-12]|nr:MAG: hypothetical protein ABS46_19330 [Cytophagaceae bacterium SCN 52-12]